MDNNDDLQTFRLNGKHNLIMMTGHLQVKSVFEYCGFRTPDIMYFQNSAVIAKNVQSNYFK